MFHDTKQGLSRIKDDKWQNWRGKNMSYNIINDVVHAWCMVTVDIFWINRALFPIANVCNVRTGPHIYLISIRYRYKAWVT